MSERPSDNQWIYGQRSEDPLIHAFKERKIADPRFELKKVKIASNDLPWTEVLKGQGSERQAAYIHIPFCSTQCSFCRFFKNFGHDSEAIDRYAQILVSEIKLTAEQTGQSIKPIEALYFGGGTPSILSPQNITTILGSLKQELPFSPNAEITFEARLKDLTPEKIAACIEGGINRFSIGIQSFDTNVRKLMSRFLPREQVVDQLSKFVGLGPSISVDLVFGLPHQDLSIWEADITQAISLGIDEIDIYQLDDTMLKARFGDKLNNFPLADAETRARMYKVATTLLRAHGYFPRNNTHWVKDDSSRNLYTSIIRTGLRVPQNDLVAFGSGAIGKAGDFEYTNSHDLQEYAEAIEQGHKPIAFFERVESNWIYELMCQIDYGSIDLNIFKVDYGIDISGKFEDLINAYIEIGLVVVKRDVIELTDAGRFWKNNIALAFNIKNNMEGDN